MHFPATGDTIVAVSTGWAATPIGVVRLSGPESFKLVGSLAEPAVASGSPAAGWTDIGLRVDSRMRVPALAYWFPGPRSYTGQDVVELHTVGAPPLLRELSARLIERGARRALPGEFTARAYLAGKLDREQVEDVLMLLRFGGELQDRRAIREVRTEHERRVGEVCEHLLDLLAEIEAEIDFVDEEDVQAAEPAELLSSIDKLTDELSQLAHGEEQTFLSGRPTVALAGLPNAGKSSLFNLLLGERRAITSPTLGTTRDVLAADVEVNGVPVVLQDCAGLGDAESELELAARRSAEEAADAADLVLWVHAVDQEWTQGELHVIDRIPEKRRLLAWSKCDVPGVIASGEPPRQFAGAVRTSATLGLGLDELGRGIGLGLEQSGADLHGTGSLRNAWGALSALRRARKLVAAQSGSDKLVALELVATELREAYETMGPIEGEGCVESVLERIFTGLCVGK